MKLREEKRLTESSGSERMVRAPGKTGGQRLNHEDCKVAGLQRSRSGETIDQRSGLGLSRYALSQQMRHTDRTNLLDDANSSSYSTFR